MVIPFERSYDITDVDDAVGMIRMLIECFPKIEGIEFIGTSNCWSSGEHASFKVEYKGNKAILMDASRTVETDELARFELNK